MFSPDWSTPFVSLLFVLAHAPSKIDQFHYLPALIIIDLLASALIFLRIRYRLLWPGIMLQYRVELKRVSVTTLALNKKAHTMDSFTPMQADDPTYSSAIRGGWQLLKNDFKTLWLALLIFIFLLGIGIAIDVMLTLSAPTYGQLWRFPIIVWITLLDLGLFYLLAKSLTNQSWHLGNLFWAFKRGGAWVLAFIYAAIGSILEAYSGIPIVLPGQKLPADWFMHQQIWIMLIPLLLLGIFFGYVLMLYSAYGLSAKMSITSSLGIFWKKWKWLFFPFALSAILLLAYIGVGIVLAIFFGILFLLLKYLGSILVSEIVLALLGVIILMALYMAILIWVYGSLLIATGTLMDTRSMRDKPAL